MTSMQLFENFSGVDEALLVQAAKMQTCPVAVKKAMPKHRLFIALIAILALLLAGCVAVIIGLQQRRVGQFTGTVYKDADGNWIEPTEQIRNMVALAGYEGTDNYRATLQWLDFIESDTPCFGQSWQENLASLYGCFDGTMYDKLREILAQYHLSALPEEICFGRWDEAYVLDILGTSGVVKADRGMWAQCLDGYLFPNGTFSMDMHADLPDWDTTISISLICCPTDTFFPMTVSTENGMEQWSYTTVDETPVVMALGDKIALLFCQKTDSYMTAVVNFDLFESDAARKPTRTVLEALADTIDFTLQPRPLSDPQEVRAHLEQTSQAHYAAQEAQNALPEYTSFSDYLKGSYTDFTEDMVYTCLSLDDGAEALLIGSGDGQRELLTSRDGVYIRDVYTVRCDRAYALQIWANMRLLTDDTLEYIQQTNAEERVNRFHIAGGQLQQTLCLWYCGQEGRYLQDTDMDRYYDTDLTKQAYAALVENKTYASVSWQPMDDLR